MTFNRNLYLLGTAGVVALFVIVLLIVLISRDKKEGMHFKVTGHKNKRACQNYHLGLYWNCVKNNNGIDPQNYCWANAEPNLVACNKDYF